MRTSIRLSLYLSLICFSLMPLMAEVTSADSFVPGTVKFAGTLNDTNGKPLTGIVGVTFLLYKEQSGGAPLWTETQNVQVDKNGRYSVMLGSTTSHGIPADAFAAGQARWIGVQPTGQAEQVRVELGSVPYAMKAADAQTLGGLPPSAFLLASPSASTDSAAAAEAAEAATAQQSPVGTKPVTTAGGTAKALAKFDAGADIATSQIVDDGTHVGIGTKTPKAKLDVKGDSVLRGPLNLPAAATATATAGKNSQPLNVTASAFNSGTTKAVGETFRWQTEPVGNNTTNPSGTLNLLFGSGGTTPSETGLSVSNKGLISFAPGQTFPGTGSGTVTSVALSAPAGDFSVSGSPITGSGTLNLQWEIPPTSEDTPFAIVKRDVNGDAKLHALFVDGFINSRGAINSTVSTPGVAAVLGNSTVTSDLQGFGVEGIASSPIGVGVFGQESGGGIGVLGAAGFGGASGQGVWGESSGNQVGANGFGPDGVDGISHSDLGSGVAAVNTAGGDGLFAQSSTGFAAFFLGDVDVDGTLSKAAGSFKIDHPLDPANKYLYHSFVESPDMMNIYNGNIALDANGEAVITLPEWFETLNRDFRYQLTPIGAPVVLYVAEEVSGNKFKIAGGHAGSKVSWQITGIRQDAYANAHRIPVEQAKPERERGLYLHPELFGAPAEKSIAAARHTGAMKMVREHASLHKEVK